MGLKKYIYTVCNARKGGRMYARTFKQGKGTCVCGTRETEKKNNRNELRAIRIASNGLAGIISVAKSICNQRCSRSLLVSAGTSIVRIYYNAIRGERYRTFK